MSDTVLSLQSIVVRSSRVFSQEVDTDVVILHMDRGEYFASEIVGQYIWRFLEKPTSISAICDQIQDVFKEIDRSTCEQDVLEFLEELRKVELVEVRG